MSDDDLLLRRAPPPKPTPPEVVWANRKSWIAILISVLAVGFTGLSWWENHERNRLAQSPYLQIEKVEFVGPNSMFMTVKNIGTAPALKPTVQDDIYIGIPFQASSSYKKADSTGAPMSVGPDIPTQETVQMAAYLPSEVLFKQRNQFDSTMAIELRGRISYRDDKGSTSSRPFCYQVLGAYKELKPAARACVYPEDFGLTLK